jgi:queuine/archaeosine tRNA-ribosyltransferase
MFTPPKQSRKSRSPFSDPQHNAILENTYHTYHTPVGKLYTRSNNSHNFNSANVQK